MHVYTVTDVSAGPLPTGMTFYVAVQPHLRQVSSNFFFGGGEDIPIDGLIMCVNMRAGRFSEP